MVVYVGYAQPFVITPDHRQQSKDPPPVEQVEEKNENPFTSFSFFFLLSLDSLFMTRMIPFTGVKQLPVFLNIFVETG